MNGFGITGALSLAFALKENSSLIELDISNNRIPVDGVAQFGRIFSTNDTLEILRMGQNPMQIHGSYALIKFLHDSNNTSLQILDLTDVMVLDIFMEMVMKIKSFNPGFRVKVGKIVSSPAIKLETGKSREISTENPLMIVVTYMESQRMRIVDLFKTWDADNSMSLTRDEFKEGLQMLDGDGNGEIELSELIQAIEKDNKGMRRKAALAVKADGPFPTNTDDKPAAEKNILEELNEMVEEGHSNTVTFQAEYDSALIMDGNPRYRLPPKPRGAKRDSLLESDFDF
ncbi:leucine-rich repeat-containing protein 74A-like [Watersipora subatra]|uniref:leucine-rich repeat-containing protein 74A-like n=1 Tax=Watersipora subatra TaxID=2589382 RepID=UPI00355C6DAE